MGALALLALGMVGCAGRAAPDFEATYEGLETFVGGPGAGGGGETRWSVALIGESAEVTTEGFPCAWVATEPGENGERWFDGQVCGERFEFDALAGYAIADGGYVGLADMPDVVQIALRFRVAATPGGEPGEDVYLFSFVGSRID